MRSLACSVGNRESAGNETDSDTSLPARQSLDEQALQAKGCEVAEGVHKERTQQGARRLKPHIAPLLAGDIRQYLPPFFPDRPCKDRGGVDDPPRFFVNNEPCNKMRRFYPYELTCLHGCPCCFARGHSLRSCPLENRKPSIVSLGAIVSSEHREGEPLSTRPAKRLIDKGEPSGIIHAQWQR